MTLFAAIDPAVQTGLYLAATGLMIGLANLVQSALKDRKDARVAREKAAADKLAAEEKAAADKAALEATARTLAAKTDQTAKAVTEKLDKALNGEGLGGKLKEIAAWQEAHDRLDNERHTQVLTELSELKKGNK